MEWPVDGEWPVDEERSAEEDEAYAEAYVNCFDWVEVAKTFPWRTTEEVESHFSEYVYKVLTHPKQKINLRNGRRWTNQQYRMSTNYERREGGNTVLVRCKKKTSVACRFMQVVTDDLLQDIFLRLPNGGSVIRSTTVCKRWHSLVHNYPSFDNFVTRFVQHHADPYSDPTRVAALFRFSISMPFYELSLTTTRPRTYDLSLMPDPESLIIRASCGDLLLLSSHEREYYICNSVTRHWFLLPNIPDSIFAQLPDAYFEVNSQYHGYALVCHNPVSYSVVIIVDTYAIGECRFHVVLFKSSTGEWTQTPISLQYELLPNEFLCKRFSAGNQLVCTRQGVVHWLQGTREQIHSVAAFDPVRFKTRLIRLPYKFGCHAYDAKNRVQLGVVQGRLRVVLTKEIKELTFRVQIWELGNVTMVMIHDLFLTMEDSATKTLFSVLCLDPYDGNAIYLMRGNRISRYEIGQTEDVGICKFPWHGKKMAELRDLVAQRLQVLPLLHPPWPTQISSLAASTHQP